MLEETIEKRRRHEQQEQGPISPLLNGAAQQAAANDDDNMVGYIGTSERRYIQAGSIPTLSNETARIRNDDSTDDFCTGGVSNQSLVIILSQIISEFSESLPEHS